MASRGVLFYFLILHLISGLDASCSHITYTTINNIRRSTAYNATSELCDRDFIQDGSWYRFKSPAGDKMPEFNPGRYHCGTYIPIWMKGEHPTVVGKEVDRIACAPVPWVFPLDCGDQFNIKVINCSSFFLYRLEKPKRCTYAYCAGSNLPRKCSADGSSIPVCPDVVPIIMKPKAKPKHEPNREFVALRCYWYYPYDASHIEFHVRWFRDSNHTHHTIQFKFNGTASSKIYESLYEPKVYPDRITNKPVQNDAGYEWNKKPFCQVRGRFHGGNWSVWKSSETIFTGIAVHPRTIYLNQCGAARSKEVFVSLRPHLPIRKKSFTFEVTYNSKRVGKICVRGQLKGKRCSTTLTTRHTFYRPFWFRITAICPIIDSESNQTNEEVSFHNPVRFKENNAYWAGYNFLPIKISIAARETKFCKSLTDPNIETFDGRHYNPGHAGKEGLFRLYRNRHFGTEVQARIDYCCNCGVAIREGYYFKIFELCSSLASNDPIPQVKSSYISDIPLNGFYTEKTSANLTVGEQAIVHLPSGITVTIGRRWSSFDIIIKAPETYNSEERGSDKHRHSEGLCGNFNGDPNDDFEGVTMGEFAELHRIRNRSEDIFAYEPNKNEVETLYDECIKQDVCICKEGVHVCNSAEVVTECSPPEQNANLTDLIGDVCHGGQKRIDGRKKRALDSRDDDIDDQDVIPPYNPARRNSTAPTWPTPSGLTEENVTETCNRKIRYSKAGKSCGTVAGVDLDALVRQCISDIKLTDDVSWAVANFGAMNEICKKNVYKNITYYKNSTDGKLQIETTVLDSLCPNDCSDNGECSNSTCTCFEDYTAADCSISLKDSPILYGIRKSGLCDVRRRPCQNVGIYAYPLLNSKNLTCHVQGFRVNKSVWIPDTSISLYPGEMMDFTEVKCFLPESPVNIGDYGNEGVTAAGLKIAVSNNRINASKEHMLFITYDSVCQECNTTTGCVLKTDACFISGHCFAQNQSHYNDWCQQCLPQISTKSWEKRRDNQSPRFLSSTVLHAFLGKELRVQLNAIDPENRTIRYTFAKNSTREATLTEEGLFTCTKSTNDTTIYTFNVTDECGAYSVLDASVVIKECPCKNSGECHPDYHYLDGAGNFTCSCPADYTGILCELDVDECNVSKPCFNGSCNNKQPGFSCSCFAGYTGDLCQNEIDECASDPCFLGVPCTDKIASFKCGPCPNGYSGNGENCTRIDGKVDECVKNPQICHSNGKCAYSNGSYVCQCAHGYKGDGKNNCTDVDECIQNPGVCDTNANCTNTEGSYTCECFRGYTGDGERNCSDIDECTSPNVCIQNAQCSNTVGTYVCECTVGYSGDGYSNCTDVNECNVPSACHQNATCTNSEGSYSCQCESGYSGDGKINCTDINECMGSLNICHRHANCSNVQGSYSCHCRTGFSGDGKLSCDDINECQQSPSVCHPLAKCSNTEGSFSCQCGVGYTGNGFVNCTDVDECFQSVSVCYQHAECTNTIGSYSCQCKQGFIGDGMQNCAENQPPQFTIPSEVYAILNNDFQIQVMAEDPEKQNMTFTLLSNGTLTATAQITKQLLEISNLKQNGTVYVQVEDEMGAKNIFILHVNAMECPCEHNGKCYRKPISYPVQPSHYLCQCEDPYTGDLCREIRPNPCDKLPCYPGLECSPAQNSEEFTCEECPPLFQGDGKQCELQETEEQSSVESEMTLTNQKWDDRLKTKTSDVYKNLASQLTIEIRNIYKTRTGFSYVIIKGFRPGSIIVDFELIFTKEVEDPLEPLMEVVKTGKLGNMTVKMETTQDEGESDSSEKKIFGLDKTIFFVIVGAAVVFILMIIVAIYLRVKRHRTHRVAMLRARILNTSDKKPQGIAFQPTNASGSEEIDLKVFDNEAIHLDEEIKIQP